MFSLSGEGANPDGTGGPGRQAMAVGLRASSNALRQLTMRRRSHKPPCVPILDRADENHPECPDQVEVLCPTSYIAQSLLNIWIVIHW